MNKLSAYFIKLVLILMLSGTQSFAGDQPVRVGMSTAPNERNPVHHWAIAFQDRFAEGDRKVTLYPSSLIGREIERAEQVILGLLQVNVSMGQDVMNYSPLLKTLRLPFLFQSTAQLDCLLQETDFLDIVNAKTTGHGIRVLDVALSGGMSQLLTSRNPGSSLDGISKLRIRAMDRTQMLTIGSWGALQVKVPWEEVQSALQTGIVDGYLNPPAVALQFNHTRQLPYMMMLNSFAGFRFVTVSEKWFQSLDTQTQEQLSKAILLARAKNRKRNFTQQKRDLELISEKGVDIIYPNTEDLTEISKMSQNIYTELVDQQDIDLVSGLLNKTCPVMK